MKNILLLLVVSLSQFAYSAQDAVVTTTTSATCVTVSAAQADLLKALESYDYNGVVKAVEAGADINNLKLQNGNSCSAFNLILSLNNAEYSKGPLQKKMPPAVLEQHVKITKKIAKYLMMRPGFNTKEENGSVPLIALVSALGAAARDLGVLERFLAMDDSNINKQMICNDDTSAYCLDATCETASVQAVGLMLAHKAQSPDGQCYKMLFSGIPASKVLGEGDEYYKILELLVRHEIEPMPTQITSALAYAIKNHQSLTYTVHPRGLSSERTELVPNLQKAIDFILTHFEPKLDGVCEVYGKSKTPLQLFADADPKLKKTILKHLKTKQQSCLSCKKDWQDKDKRSARALTCCSLLLCGDCITMYKKCSLCREKIESVIRY